MRLETRSSSGGLRTCYSPKYSYFIFKDNIVDNFSDRFLCTGMTENTNAGLFTLPFHIAGSYKMHQIRLHMLSPHDFIV